MSILSNMEVLSSDTDPAVEAFQIALIQKSSTARRGALMCSLSDTVLELSRRAIRRANPGLHNQELKCRFVEYHYGEELAQHLRAYLKKRV